MVVRKKKKPKPKRGAAPWPKKPAPKKPAPKKRAPKKPAPKKPAPKKPPKARQNGPAPFHTAFLDRFETGFIEAAPGWPTQPFDTLASITEIALILRVMLELSDFGVVSADVPASALRTRLEAFLAAEDWLGDRVPGTEALFVRHKEIAVIADLLVLLHHFGGGGGGDPDDWPPHTLR